MIAELRSPIRRTIAHNANERIAAGRTEFRIEVSMSSRAPSTILKSSVSRLSSLRRGPRERALPGGQALEVGIDHHLDELFEVHLSLPAQHGAGF